MPTTVRAQQGDTVDVIAWRHYGQTRDRVEAILLANPGLADRVILPLGTPVLLPDISQADSTTQTLINLWD